MQVGKKNPSFPPNPSAHARVSAKNVSPIARSSIYVPGKSFRMPNVYNLDLDRSTQKSRIKL